MLVDIVPWLELVFRWIHVVTAIAWIGASFYFIWLDGNLRPGGGNSLVAGELWAVHGGGFYHNQKYLVAPAQLPAHLHWFKYEAYFTWISGFLLLALMYYAGAGLFLIDNTKLALSPGAAISISLLFLGAGWLIYDGLCRSPLGRNTALFGVFWFGILTATAYLLTRIFSDRAAFLMVGAIIGTAMTANVFFIIIPNQKKVVSALLSGATPKPFLGAQAKQRSLHNNYMTLPVILCMISNHFPMFYSSEFNWVVLAILSAASVVIRHVFNLRHKGVLEWPLVIVSLVLFVTAVSVASLQKERPSSSPKAEARFSDVRQILNKHCVTCHSARPSHADISAPPAGLDFTDDAVVRKNASRILFQTVTTKVMPLGNETHMTDADRRLLSDGLRNVPH